ncbi:MAG: four helix bundle protein [Patescibacteria group bacterium]|jgi:four helix bundle protein
MYDLRERTSNFSVKVIEYLKACQQTTFNKNIIEQLLRSSTSIGANYREAGGAVSKKDFITKLAICKKEAMETEYWLELLNKEESNSALERLRNEIRQLIFIFSSSLKTA